MVNVLSMLELPTVPNWLQWVAVSAVPLSFLWALAVFLWRRFLSDLWAKRTRETAENRAAILIQQFRLALKLNDEENDRRFQAISATVLSELILGVFYTTFGSVIILLSNYVTNLFVVVGFLIISWGVLKIAKAVDTRQKYIMPFVDWDEYFDRTLARIGSLLTKAGISDEEQVEFIDELVFVADDLSSTQSENDE